MIRPHITIEEDDDLFAREPPPLPPTAWITCRICGLRSKVGTDNPALVCGPCRADTAQTRMHIEEGLRTVEARWQAAVESWTVPPALAAEWAKVEAAQGTVEPALFVVAWARAKKRGGPLADLLEAKERLDAISDELQAKRQWAEAALRELDALS